MVAEGAAAWVFRSAWPLALGTSFLGTLGCSATGLRSDAHRYQTFQRPPLRNSDIAKTANAEGMRLIRENQPDRAADAFRRATCADVSYGAAHNNLGLVRVEQEKFYEAALEFAFAAKLMPNSCEPQMNLGRMYERLGWWKEAQQQYETALTLAPENVDALGRLARCEIQQGHPSQEAAKLLLARLAEQDEHPKWKAWALAEIDAQQSEP